MTPRGLGVYGRLFRGVFLALILILPLMRGAWDQWAQTLVHVLWAFFLLLGGLLAGLDRARQDPLPVALPRTLLPVFGALAAFTLWSALSSPYRASAWPAALNEFAAIGFFALGAAVPIDRRPLFARALAGAAALAVAAALAERPAAGSAVGLLVNANVLAGALVLGIPLTAVLAGPLSAGPSARWLWGGAAVVSVFGLLLTGSLTGYLVLLLQGGALYVFLWRRRGVSWKWPAGGLVLAAGLGAFLFSSELWKLLGEGDRWAWWRAAFSMAASHPVFGVGPGAYGEAYPAFRVATWGLNSLYAHNFLWETLAERGPVVLAALLYVLYKSFRRGWEGGPLDKALLVGTAGFCLYNMAHIGFAFPALAWLFWTALGLLWAAPGPRGRGAGFALAGAGLLLGAASLSVFRANQLTAQARHAMAQGGMAAAALIERGLAWDPWGADLYQMRAALAYAAGETGAAARDLNRAIALAPTRAGFRRDAAELALERGDAAAALRLYDEATALLPLDPGQWTRRGEILAKAGEKEAARASYQNALRALEDARVLGGDPARREAAGRAVRERLETLDHAQKD